VSGKPEAGAGPSADGAQRIDRWLWFARFLKTRSLASKLVETGRVRLEARGMTVRVEKPSTLVRAGDILTFPQGSRVRVVRVLAPGTRRGPAPEAAELYEDLDPPAQSRASGPQSPADRATGPMRDAGSGRPTKRERRQMDRLRDGK
jgi:ribosome-associated heat shock protein Hsp15